MYSRYALHGPISPELDGTMDSLDIVGTIRGILFAFAGLCGLAIFAFFDRQPFYLIGAMAGLGLGGWDLWWVNATLKDDEAKRRTSPERVQNTVTGLTGADWSAARRKDDDLKPNNS